MKRILKLRLPRPLFLSTKVFVNPTFMSDQIQKCEHVKDDQDKKSTESLYKVNDKNKITSTYYFHFT